MFFGEWLIYVVSSIFLYGLVQVLDCYFVERGDVYKDEYEGMIISSVYKILGVAIVGGIYFTKTMEISFVNALLAVAGGILMSGAFLFYFFAIFEHNDGSLLQMFWNLAIPLIVVFAWLFLGERLEINTYLGIGIVFVGGTLIYVSKEVFHCENFGKFMLFMIPMVILYALSDVLMKYVEEGRKVEFGQSFPFLCLGQVLFGGMLLLVRRKKIQGTGFIKRIAGQNWFLFVSSEALELAALFFMQLSIAKTPSVSFHGTMEAFMPVMVIIISFISIFFLKFFGKGEIIKRIHDEYLSSGLLVKLTATAVMMVGIYLIG